MTPESREGDYALPIDGLVISRGFSIGPVAIYKSSADLPFVHEVNWAGALESHMLSTEGRAQTIACVHASSPNEAIFIIQQALEIFRVFQYGLMRSAHYTHFGLPGEITASSIFYIRHNERGSVAGFTSSGLHLGFELDNASIDSWEQHAHALQFAADAIGDSEASEGAKRALKGIRYFSRSILAHEPDLRVLLIIAGLESMLSTDGEAPGRFTLARYLTYLSCWKSGPCSKSNGLPCAYLVLDPSNKKDLDLVRRLERLMQKDTVWECTYWQKVNTWYETRSGFVHGNSYETDSSEARNFAYWAYHQYVAPVLGWLLGHPENPTGALKEGLSALEAVNIDWRTIVRAGDVEKLISTRNAQNPLM